MTTVETALAATEAVTGIAALGGALYGLRGAPDVPLEWLDGSPFDSYAIPSVVLGTCVGATMLVAADAVVRQRPEAGRHSCLAGVVLAAWIGAQVRTIGWRSPLQPACLGIAVLTVTLARRLP